jgi:hypothetical protein
VGGIAGYVIMLERITQGLNCGDGYYDTCNNTNSDTALTGLLVAVVSVGIGLRIGIPGIVKMARQSEEETEAVNRYQDSVSMRSMRFPYPHSLPYLRPHSARHWAFRFFPCRSELVLRRFWSRRMRG